MQFLDQKGAVHVLSLPVKDKKRLTSLMTMLFAEDNFAYTLLGSKPVSWASYTKPLPFVDLSRLHNSWKKYCRTLRLGWETWAKYSYLFPSTVFFAENSKCHPGSGSVLIVNPERFNAVVNENKEDFQNVLHREVVDGFQLLREARKGSLMDDVLEGHQALIGIVLGYGRDNSWAFLEGAIKRQPIGWVWEDSASDEVIGGIDIESCLASCPSFAGYPGTEESLALKKDYLQTQEKIINYYKGKDFLEATLSLLAGFRPDSQKED